MAMSVASMAPQSMVGGLNSDPSTASMDDPFITNPQQPPQSHRHSTFDSHLFNLNASSSPTQAKRALEAHLAETERRLQETSKLGTNLVNQRAQLSEKLKEVEKQQNEAEIGPELRQKLLDLEKEYNEVGRDSTRAFLGPKSKLAISDDAGKSGGQNVGPATFSSQATASPTKVSVPSRTQRNKPSSKIDNIEFATEISTSLLAQVRQLQALLTERDETLKTVSLEKSRLELEAEGFSQHIKTLDENEQRYKDENWSLETQTHELIAAAKDSADREKKLVASLGIATAEKQGAQRDFDELKQSHSKLVEDHAAKQKAHDSELHTLRRNLTSGDTERATLQRKVEELTSQNQELARAVATRFRHEDPDSMRDTGSSPEDLSLIRSSPEHSPPPSPSKGTPRHNHLESETLKSSLHHAHRMMQNLKGNIHREKTEKMELKRMLQEARDELELRRGEPGGPNSGSKRQKTKSQDAFKKPARPGVLGAGRNSKTEYEMDEDWEDHIGENSPSQAAASRYPKVDAGNRRGNPTDMSDAYQTANETEDAFETANERETESEAFQTGAESLAGDSSDELTETEQNVDRAETAKAKKPIPTALTKPGNRSSYLSTASTSAGEEEDELHTPVQTQMPRYRLRVGRGSSRRSKIPDDVIFASGTPESNKDSPASFTSNRSPPTQGGQSLFAELNDLNGDEDADFGTPSKSSIYSDRPTPGRTDEKIAEDPEYVPIHRAAMVDSSMQTDPIETSEASRGGVSSWIAAAGGLLTGGALASHHEQGKSADSEVADSATQYTPQKGVQAGNLATLPKTTGDESMEKSLSSGQSMPNSHDSENRPAPLTFSPVGVQHTVPVSPRHSRAPPAPMTLSNIQAQETTPVSPIVTPARSSRRPIVDYSTPVATQTEDVDPRPRTAEKADAKTGILGSIFGRKGRRGSQPSIAEDETSLTPRADAQTTQESSLPFRDISANVGPRGMGNTERLVKPVDGPLSANDKFDQGSQTILSSDQIDQILTERSRQPSSSKEADYVQPAPVAAPATPTRSQRPTSQSRPADAVTREALSVQTTPKRPGSAGSNRMSTASLLPPLPADHRQAIEAARGSSSGTASSVMGPPLAPASAYRVNSRLSQRSVDPVQSPNSKAGTTPRARLRGSRRSSVSSFASELDERFNIRANEYGVPQGFEPGTDPRMIQAITQTMIGEFLWKYTRKAGRPDMSTTRHRRYFWVHPYTRTLYWCDQDPQSAGRNELKAKSVPIEAVRVIADDNPLPPGLHRKSLEVTTPGRKIKFTASTSQRHETWFNALSYLLLRTTVPPPAPADAESFSTEDISEFNPRAAYANPTRQSRATAASLSSYNSRTTRNTSFVRAPSSTSASRQPLNQTMSGASMSSEQQQQQQQQQLVPTQPQDTANPRQGSISRLSTMFKQGTIRGSFSSRRSGIDDRGDPSIYDASVVHDSTEDLKPAAPPQESEGLENVRACCDGKHDVSSLTHRHRSTGGRHSHVPGPSSWTGSRSHRH